MAKLIMYSLTYCPTCEKARQALTERGVEFEERLVNESPQWYDEMLNYADSVPVLLWEDGRVEIGWEGEEG